MRNSFTLIISLLFLFSCKASDPPERVMYSLHARELYTFVDAYYRENGYYPENLDDVKKSYVYNQKRRKFWNNYINNKWHYIKPDKSKGKQIILKDYKYGIFVEIDFIDGFMKLSVVNDGKGGSP